MSAPKPLRDEYNKIQIAKVLGVHSSIFNRYYNSNGISMPRPSRQQGKYKFFRQKDILDWIAKTGTELVLREILNKYNASKNPRTKINPKIPKDAPVITEIDDFNPVPGVVDNGNYDHGWIKMFFNVRKDDRIHSSRRRAA